ncbi:MAG TPA: hypothetical protein PLO37_16345 [Candidatus Hydrogenedentes bacterium]|nr:hypothetical protein [Candidatus Hydrogenedentota bacterium]
MAVLAGLLTGCPELIQGLTDPDYAEGFAEGFLRDDWYWSGFDDGYATVDGGPIYYQGSTIPVYESPPYDAGYWDGVWYAYNDGYFVEYDYAFTIGFSEGYDAAYAADYLAFLGADTHLEYLDGGWTDGYNDGFSEGRVFGANDFEMGLPFDWLGALTDYRGGLDLYFAEVGVGTGSYGPVALYEYGTDPALLKSDAPKRDGVSGPSRAVRTTRVTKASQDDFEPPELSYRPFTEPPEAFNAAPTVSTRGARPLQLTTTWIERIEAYRVAAGLETKSAGGSLRSFSSRAAGD